MSRENADNVPGKHPRCRILADVLPGMARRCARSRNFRAHRRPAPPARAPADGLGRNGPREMSGQAPCDCPCGRMSRSTHACRLKRCRSAEHGASLIRPRVSERSFWVSPQVRLPTRHRLCDTLEHPGLNPASITRMRVNRRPGSNSRAFLLRESTCGAEKYFTEVAAAFTTPWPLERTAVDLTQEFDSQQHGTFLLRSTFSL